jgi:hypothetical protein
MEKSLFRISFCIQEDTLNVLSRKLLNQANERNIRKILDSFLSNVNLEIQSRAIDSLPKEAKQEIPERLDQSEIGSLPVDQNKDSQEDTPTHLQNGTHSPKKLAESGDVEDCMDGQVPSFLSKKSTKSSKKEEVVEPEPVATENSPVYITNYTETLDIISDPENLYGQKFKQKGYKFIMIEKGKTSHYMVPHPVREDAFKFLRKEKIPYTIREHETRLSRESRQSREEETKTAEKKLVPPTAVKSKETPSNPPEKVRKTKNQNSQPTQEKEKEKEHVPVTTPTRHPLTAARVAGARITATKNSFGNRVIKDTNMVVVTGKGGAAVVVGYQDLESDEKGLDSVFPLTETHRQYCLSKGWKYDDSVLQENN